MRRWTLGTAVFSLFALSAAPLAAQVPVTFGPMAGASFYSLHGSDAEELDSGLDKGSRVGFTVGAFAEIEMGGKFAIEPQLLYVQKGGKFTGEQDGVEGTLTMKFDYIQVPVLLKYEFRNPTGKITPALFVGPAMSFKIKCSTAVKVPDVIDESADCPDDTIKSTEFSAVFGGGVEFGKWSLQGRYDMGLASIISDADVKNGGFLVTLGYGF